MKIIDVQQNTPEWMFARLGTPTSSCFDRVLTPTGKPSTQASAYANKLVAEWLCGEPLDEYSNQWTERGHGLEVHARNFYELQADVEVEQVGFIKSDDGSIGTSPDGLVGDNGLLEIKCPAPHTHVDYLLTGKMPAKYKPQVQGQMLVTGRHWCDFLSFHPLMPPVLVRVERDEKYITKLITEIESLVTLLVERKATLQERGIVPMAEAA